MTKKIIIVAILILSTIFMYEKIDYQNHTVEIENIFVNDISKNEHDYIGYVEIERLHIKREIVMGITDKNLLNHVAMSSRSKNLDEKQIILAGHGIKNIFGNLRKIKMGDIIKIHSFDNTHTYQVERIDIVNPEQTDVIDQTNLILITCTNDNKRFIVKAKKIE